jgi:GNAT superfamily N-acetyltransferase
MTSLNSSAESMVTADGADVDILSQVIADAFHELAPSHWLIPDPDARRAIFPGYFRLYVEHAMADGVVHTTPDRAAVALWLEVGAHGPSEPADYGERLAAATHPWTHRFLAFDRVLERHHPIGIAHRHLAILAVRPDRQGQGIGTALLRSHHAVLDDEPGTPAYLEASDRRTRQLYLAHGYRDHGAPIHLAGGPLMHPMWRNALVGNKQSGARQR